jgi:hypothetical protein|tara:strand:+ start:6145 stop:7188 length:1044 start_codon:yes stop_codon:yes gene_type:complete
MTVTPTPSMPYTTAGICTKDIDDPGSQTFVPGRLNQADRKLFKGIVSECRDHQSSEEQLQSIHCNWTVEAEKLFSRQFDREYPEVIHWYQSDNGDKLGQFTDKRFIVNPLDALNWYKKSIENKPYIHLDGIGWLPHNKVLYFFSKMTNLNTPELLKVGDTTDFFLMYTINYAKAQSMKATVYANELVCENGMTRRLKGSDTRVNHRQKRDSIDVEQAMDVAITTGEKYIQDKIKMINTPCTINSGVTILRKFFEKMIPEEDRSYLINTPTAPVKSNLINQLERIYKMDLIGDELETRQNNIFRLHSAVTQFTSHVKHVKNGDEARFAQQLDGPIARLNADFTDFLLR